MRAPAKPIPAARDFLPRLPLPQNGVGEAAARVDKLYHKKRIWSPFSPKSVFVAGAFSQIFEAQTRLYQCPASAMMGTTPAKWNSDVFHF